MDISFPNLAVGTCDAAFRTYQGRICAHFRGGSHSSKVKDHTKGEDEVREENSGEMKVNKNKKHNQSGETVIIRVIIILGKKLCGCATASLPKKEHR